MRLMIDTSRVQFTVTREAQARTDQNGIQRTERNTGVPMWTVQLVAMEEQGAEVINVTVTAVQAPKVAVGQQVTPVELQAIPWAQNGRNGVAYRVTELKTATAGKATAAQAS